MEISEDRERVLGELRSHLDKLHNGKKVVHMCLRSAQSIC